MDSKKRDEIIAEAAAWVGGHGQWNQFVAHMEELGYSEAEVDRAYELFGEHVGHDLV